MKLDRNITSPWRGKYALIKLRDNPGLTPQIVEAGKRHCNAVEVKASAVDFGDTEDSEFFVIRLKDKYAAEALSAYADAAEHDDPEYAGEVRTLSLISANHQNRKRPD